MVFPEDPTYPKAIARWAFTAERNCAVVAFVKDEADIAAMIKFAVSSKLEIAVKGFYPTPL